MNTTVLRQLEQSLSQIERLLRRLEEDREEIRKVLEGELQAQYLQSIDKAESVLRDAKQQVIRLHTEQEQLGV